MSEPIRVAQIIGKMVNGGIESVIMNYYRHIDRTRVQFDFIVDNDFEPGAQFKVIPPEEIEAMGGRVYFCPPYQCINRYIYELTRLFQEKHYQIVHSHINTLSVFPLYAAKRAAVPIRIAHSHSMAGKGEILRNILKYSLRPFSKVFATHYAACSRYAGEWLFGKRTMECGEVTIFNNAIDPEKFRFNPEVRGEVRKELRIEDKFVSGHVGRFCYQKNQEFLIDVFEEVYRKNPNAVLLLIGDGKDRTKIEEKIRNLGAGRGVILLGNQNNMERLYQAMDVFMFPSRYEGFGIAAVEAQMCGVRTIVSTAVPAEVKVAPETAFLDLKDGPKRWANEIMQSTRQSKPSLSQAFDITVQAKKMTDYYGELIHAEKKQY